MAFLLLAFLASSSTDRHRNYVRGFKREIFIDKVSHPDPEGPGKFAEHVHGRRAFLTLDPPDKGPVAVCFEREALLSEPAGAANEAQIAGKNGSLGHCARNDQIAGALIDRIYTSFWVPAAFPSAHVECRCVQNREAVRKIAELCLNSRSL